MEKEAVKLKEYSFEIGSIDDSSETVAIVSMEYERSLQKTTGRIQR